MRRVPVHPIVLDTDRALLQINASATRDGWELTVRSLIALVSHPTFQVGFVQARESASDTTSVIAKMDSEGSSSLNQSINFKMATVQQLNQRECMICHIC